METLYCSRCNLFTEFRVQQAYETHQVRGEEITILTDVAYCACCNEKVFHEELDNRTLLKVYDEYRKRKGLITPERIRAIRTKYGLSQRALGRLLKLGEITINRYENGALPSDAHNELLILIEDPANVQILLDQAGSSLTEREEANLRKRLDNLLATSTQELFMESTEKILADYEPSVFSGFRKFDADKILDMVTFFANNVNNLSKTKLMKLFFYSDFCHFKNYGVSISGLRYAHLPFGPAIDNYDILITWLKVQDAIELTPTRINAEYEWESITTTRQMEGALSKEEIDTLTEILNKYGRLTANELSDHSHSEKAYTETEVGQLISYEYALDISS